MRLYRVGDEGAAVRDIQERLDALGYPTEPDPGSIFGDGTRDAVQEFQKARASVVAAAEQKSALTPGALSTRPGIDSVTGCCSSVAQ